MGRIVSEQLKRTVRETFEYTFETVEAGLYLAAISARLERGARTGSRRTAENRLRCTINGRAFPQVTLSGKLLKGQLQTLYLLVHLRAGTHHLACVPEGVVFLEELVITHYGDIGQSLVLELDIQAEDGDRRPWLMFGLVDLAVEAVTATATARWRPRDSDDVKLVVNGVVQKNPTSLLWRGWLWSGSLLKKLRQAETQTKTIATNLALGMHAIEFFADRIPTLHRVEFELGTAATIGPPRPRTYSYRGVHGNEDYDRFDGTIAKEVSDWNKEFLGQAYPPSAPLDPSLVKAIMYIESRVGYYPGGYPDVMQAGRAEKTLKILNNDGTVPTEYEWSPGAETPLDYRGEANVNTAETSIRWGVRWLYHKAQMPAGGRPRWLDWQEAVQRYGPGTASYRDAVWKVYRDGLSPEGTRLWAWAAILGPFLMAVSAVSIWWMLNEGHIEVAFENIPGSRDYRAIAKIFDGLRYEEVFLANTYINGGNFLALKKERPIGIGRIDIDGDGEDEITVTGSYHDGSQNMYTLHKHGGRFERVWHINEYGTRKEAFSGALVYFEDREGDNVLEVVESITYTRPWGNLSDQTLTNYYGLDNDGFYHLIKVEETLEE